MDELLKGIEDLSDSSEDEYQDNASNYNDKESNDKLIPLWTKHDLSILIDVIMKMFEGVKYQKSYNYVTQCKDILWKNVAEALPHKDHIQCQEALKALIMILDVEKTLEQLMREAKDLLSSDKGFQKLQLQRMYAVTEFLKENSENNDPNTISLAYRRWNYLTNDDRKRYQIRSEERNKIPVPEDYLRPYDIMKERVLQQRHNFNGKGQQFRKEVEKQYYELSKESKCQIIIESMKQLQKYEEAVENYKKMGPNSTLRVTYPKKTDLILYFTEVLNVPIMPAAYPWCLYYKDYDAPPLEQKNKVELYHIRKKHFNSCSKEIRDKYTMLYKQDWYHYYERLAVWKLEQTPLNQKLYMKYMHKQNKFWGTLAKDKITPVTWVKQVTTQNRQIFFGEEPKKLSVKPFDVYRKYFMKSELIKKEDKFLSNIKKCWNKQTVESKQSYEVRARKNHQKYKCMLVRYAQSLPEDKLKLFLGARRHKLYRWFGEDVFDEYFPNVKYPVLTFLKKRSKKPQDYFGYKKKSIKSNPKCDK